MTSPPRRLGTGRRTTDLRVLSPEADQSLGLIGRRPVSRVPIGGPIRFSLPPTDRRASAPGGIGLSLLAQSESEAANQRGGPGEPPSETERTFTWRLVKLSRRGAPPAGRSAWEALGAMPEPPPATPRFAVVRAPSGLGLRAAGVEGLGDALLGRGLAEALTHAPPRPSHPCLAPGCATRRVACSMGPRWSHTQSPSPTRSARCSTPAMRRSSLGRRLQCAARRDARAAPPGSRRAPVPRRARRLLPAVGRALWRSSVNGPRIGHRPRATFSATTCLARPPTGWRTMPTARSLSCADEHDETSDGARSL